MDNFDQQTNNAYLPALITITYCATPSAMYTAYLLDLCSARPINNDSNLLCLPAFRKDKSTNFSL